MNPERERHIPKKKYECKRNKGKHVLERIIPNGKPKFDKGQEKNQYLANLLQFKPEDDHRYSFHGFNIYICKKCGHIVWKQLDKNGNEK